MRVVIRSIDKNNRKSLSEIRMFSVYLLEDLDWGLRRIVKSMVRMTTFSDNEERRSLIFQGIQEPEIKQFLKELVNESLRNSF